jgi:hypothetical protein
MGGAQSQKKHMAYISTNYATNPNAPVGQWVCAPTSGHALFETAPSGNVTKGPNYCGQCVSYVKAVCPSLLGSTSWKKGAAVKNNADIVPGTVIATFNDEGKYLGHAAIYVNQTTVGVNVYDQWITPPTPKAVGPRMLRWGAPKISNNGDKFYVVE